MNVSDKRKIICELWKLIEMRADVFTAGLFVFLSKAQPFREYLWIAWKKWSKVGRVIVASAVGN